MLACAPLSPISSANVTREPTCKRALLVADNAVAVKVDFLAVAGREEPEFAGGVEPCHRSDGWPVVAFYLPLGAANAILKLPASALERIVDSKSQVGTPFVRRSRSLHVHFAAFRERKMNVNLIKSADVVMLARPFQHHPASRNAVPALLEFGDMFIDASLISCVGFMF